MKENLNCKNYLKYYQDKSGKTDRFRVSFQNAEMFVKIFICHDFKALLMCFVTESCQQRSST